jgi:hypothetical protein
MNSDEREERLQRHIDRQHTLLAALWLETFAGVASATRRRLDEECQVHQVLALPGGLSCDA